MSDASTALHRTSADEHRRGTHAPRRAHSHLLLLLLILGLAAGGCGGGGGTDGGAADSSAVDTTASAEKPKKKKKKPKRASVTVAEATRSQLVLPIHAEGTVRALRETDIRPEIAGRVAKIDVDEGERVRKGQVLLRLDARDYELALEEARSNILQALSTLALEQDVEGESGDRSLLDMEGDLDARLDALRRGEYRAEIAAARTGVAAAEAAEHRAHLNLERCELKAPFDGVVTGLTLAPGEWVSGGQTLFRLVDDINLEAQVNVLESDLGDLETDRPALLAFPALGETLQVKVDVISPSLDTESRSCPTLLRLDNRSGRVKPGMFTRAAIAGEILSERLLVPREAILTRDGRPLVFKVEDNITQWLYVELGDRNEQFVEIERVLQGGKLEPGDKVVVTNHLTLTHGAQVKIKRTLRPQSAWRLDDGSAP